MQDKVKDLVQIIEVTHIQYNAVCAICGMGMGYFDSPYNALTTWTEHSRTHEALNIKE